MAVPAVPAVVPLTENKEPFGVNIYSLKRGREDEAMLASEKKWPGWPGDSVFRLIVPAQKVGAIIGRKGEFVKKMCEETKSRIKILDGVPGTTERVVMVSAREEPEAVVSPAMDGLLQVHQRTINNSGTEGDGYPIIMHLPDGTVSSKLLVAAIQAGSLIGKQGATIKSIQDTSGAIVRILPPEELPLYALQDDRLVEIHGEPAKVHKAIELVASYLRKYLVDRSVLPLFELNRAVQNQSQQPIAHASWNPVTSAVPSVSTPGLAVVSHYATPNVQQESFYQAADVSTSQTHHLGVAMYGRDPNMSSVTPTVPAPIITQVTQHMQIPLSYADAIIGVGGANISHIRRTSGATITVQETVSYPGEMTVEVQGTASQVQSAQQLIQNSLVGVIAPTSSYSMALSSATYSTVPAGSYNSSVDAGYTPYVTQASMYQPSTGTSGHASTAVYGTYSGTFSY